jgi:hypothetical protein
MLTGTVLFSCKKAAEEYIRDLLEAEVIFKQDIPFPFVAPEPINSVQTPPYPVPMNVDSILRAETNNNFGKQDLKSAKMTSIKLYMPLSTPITASNLDTIRLTAQVSSSPEIFKIEVTNNFNITTEQDRYVLNIPVDASRELLDYLSASAITYSLYGKFKNNLMFTTLGYYNMIFTYKLLVRKN